MRLFEGTPFDVPPRCDRCQQLEADCQCEPLPKPRLAPGAQTAVVCTERRKRGKVATVVSGLSPDDCDLAELVTILKNFCGAGGTIKDGVMEIQGEQSDRVRFKLAELGYQVEP